MTYSSRTEAQVEAETESASDFTWDFTAKSYIQYLKEATGVQDAFVNKKLSHLANKKVSQL